MRFLISHEVAAYLVGIIQFFSFITVESARSSFFYAKDPDRLQTTPAFSLEPSLGTSSPDTSFKSPAGQPDPMSPAQKAVSEFLNKPMFSKFDSSQWVKRSWRRLSVLLSVGTSSRVDLFEYLIRETSKLSQWEIVDLGMEIDYRLKQNRIPEIYDKSYVQALQSFITVQIQLLPLKRCIRNIRDDRDRSNVPADISSPPTLSFSGLFSADIFSDSDPPMQLINRLVRISKNDISNLRSQLENYIKITNEWGYVPRVWRQYQSYAIDLLDILQTSYKTLDNLKSSMAEIQRISIVNQQNSINTESESQVPS